MISKITDKFQITIPKSVRERLMLARNDVIEWIFADGNVIVKPSKRPFMELKGSIVTGAGDIDQDIESARNTIISRFK